jgi:thioredoxin-like negative regulator of GroEL
VARRAARDVGLDYAKRVVSSIANPGQRAGALAALAKDAVAAGDLARAREITQLITIRRQKAEVLAALAEATASAEGLDQAEEIADSITSRASCRPPSRVSLR